MLRRLRTALFVLIAAALGAALGRLALDARKRVDEGGSPTDVDPTQIRLRPQDVIPGLVAAFRVTDAPWSWFHIPPWFAAFAVNFGVGALGGDLAKLKEQAERTAFELVGLDARDFGMGGDEEPEFTTTLEGELGNTPAPPPPPPPTSPSPSSPPPSPGPGASGSWPVPPTGTPST